MRYRLRTLLILLVVGGVILWGCNRQQPDSVMNPHFASQAREIERRSELANNLMAEQEESVQRAKTLLSHQEQQLERMGRVLDKLEEQAKRKDEILSAEEKQLGLKK